jgi:hypothetical protein
VNLTPTLSAECRRLFAEEVMQYNGWQPGGTVPRIADATGLTADQVRTAIFGESQVSSKWRANMARMLGGLAVSEEEYERIKAIQDGESPAEEATETDDSAVLSGELTPAQKRAATRAANKAAAQAASDAEEAAAFEAEKAAADKVEADKASIAAEEAAAAEAAEDDPAAGDAESESAIVEPDEKAAE